MHQIPKRRYWNTWSSQSPGYMEFLPSGFFIRIGAFSTKLDKYTDFPFTRTVKLYEHHPEGYYVRLQMEHGGTLLELEYYKTDEWTVVGRLHCLEHGEWALRYCPMISFGFETPDNIKWPTLNTPHIKKTEAGASANLRSYHFGIASKYKPVRDCLSKDPNRVGKDMEKNGYYTPCDDEPDSQWYIATYNLEATPEIIFAVSVSNSEEVSRQKAAAALKLFDAPGSAKSLKDKYFRNLLHQSSGEYADSVVAIRDVMAWNTIADEETNRWFIWITRLWNKKFGGWYVWNNDPYYHALMSAFAGDWLAGRMSIKATVDNNTPEGNFACLMGALTEWVDRSQPPICSFMVWRFYLLTGDKQLLEEVYPSLRSAHFWWHKYRDGNKNGVLEMGSSNVGNGQFKRTKLAAIDESSMDNSPMYDTAEFIEEAGTINMEDIALNSLLVLDGESLQSIALELGDKETAEILKKKAKKLGDAVNGILWDENRKIYANRHWENGFADPSPTSFYPLVSGIASSERAGHLLAHMMDEEEFWTPAPLPSIWKKSPAFNDNVYWRGRTWPPLNFMVYNGLKRYGFDEEAYKLAKRCMNVFDENWRKNRACYENFNSMTGKGDDSVDTDPFLGWGALLPLMWVMEHIDIDPWNGFHFGSIACEDFAFENIKMSDSLYSVNSRQGITVLERADKAVFRSDASGRFRHFKYEPHYISVEISVQKKECYVEFPDIEIIKAKINDMEISFHNKKIILLCDIGVKVEIWK